MHDDHRCLHGACAGASNLGATRQGQVRRGRRPRSMMSLALLAATIGGMIAATAPVSVSAANPAAAPIVYPGPSRGVPGTQTPTGTNFATQCNANVNADSGHVGGAVIPPGTAVGATVAGVAWASGWVSAWPTD